VARGLERLVAVLLGPVLVCGRFPDLTLPRLTSCPPPPDMAVFAKKLTGITVTDPTTLDAVKEAFRAMALQVQPNPQQGDGLVCSYAQLDVHGTGGR
jgi:hypothetical protein